MKNMEDLTRRVFKLGYRTTDDVALFITQSVAREVARQEFIKRCRKRSRFPFLDGRLPAVFGKEHKQGPH